MRIAFLIKLYPAFSIITILIRCFVVSKYLLIELKQGNMGETRSLKERIATQVDEKRRDSKSDGLITIGTNTNSSYWCQPGEYWCDKNHSY